MTKRVVVWVDGHVQGVGFRWWVLVQAQRLGLTGSATNLDDGRVEIDAQGPSEAVDALVTLCVEVPSSERRPGIVRRWELAERTPDADRTAFRVR